MCYFTSNGWIHRIFWIQTHKHVFFIKDDDVWEKYEQIWDVIKNKLDIKFHSLPVYDTKYLKTKVKEYDGAIKTIFLGNDVLKKYALYLHCLHYSWFCYENE